MRSADPAVRAALIVRAATRPDATLRALAVGADDLTRARLGRLLVIRWHERTPAPQLSRRARSPL